LHDIKPISLADGLNPENVCVALVKANPTTVYAHTGLGTLDGRKANEK
jgi:phosphoribosylanthranilate isomerase